jgi:sulfur-oxidizing protein SoxY
MGAGVAATMLLPDSHAFAATEADAATRIADFLAGKPAVSGKITIDLPDIAENGNSVPLSVLIDSPMTPDDHVSEVLVVADRNPRPVVATFHFTTAMGRAEAATRIRLAATQTVTVAARTSTGALFVDSRPVKVTIGGCGG